MRKFYTKTELTQSFCATFRRSRIERERLWFVNKTANERDFREEFAQISKIRVLDDRVLKIRVLDDTVLIQPPQHLSESPPKNMTRLTKGCGNVSPTVRLYHEKPPILSKTLRLHKAKWMCSVGTSVETENTATKRLTRTTPATCRSR